MKKRLIRAGIITVSISIVLCIITVLAIVFDGDDADLSYRTLDYEATVTADGDLNVTQHIDMKLKKRTDYDDDTVRPWKQLYQRYTLESDKLTDITDITVTNVTDGRQYRQTMPALPSAVDDAAWNSEYADRWYIADVTDNEENSQPYEPGKDGLTADPHGEVQRKTIEIGWNIPATESAESLKFDISFTMHDVVSLYNDVAAFQWEPFGSSNQVPINRVTGTLHFPSGVTDNTSWAWLHTEVTSTTRRDADNTLVFTANDLKAGDYLDVVAAFDASAADGIARVYGSNRLDYLKRTEAQQEQAWRDRQRRNAQLRVLFWVLTIVVGAALCAWAIIAVIRSNKVAQYHGPIEYWRDKPQLNPTSAARMIDVVDSSDTALQNRQMAAAMLSLAVKKAIAIYPGPSSLYRGIDMSQATPVARAGGIGRDPNQRDAMRKTSTIVILTAVNDGQPDTRQLDLTQSEQALLNLLVKISHRVECPVFDLEQMQKSCSNWKNGYESLEQFTTSAANEFALLGATRNSSQWIVAGIFAALLGYGALIANGIMGYTVAGFLTGFPVSVIGLFCSMAGSLRVLTPAGQEPAGQVLGLKRYMEDFSDFSDRGTADLMLWDWYMVYAAAFGISERVARELAKAYPQVTDPEWLDANGGDHLWYWSYYTYAGNRAAVSPSGAGSLMSAAGAEFAFGGDSFSAGFTDIGSQISAGLADISSTIQAAAPSSSDGSGGSFSDGGFGGSFGGSGGGSFGGR